MLPYGKERDKGGDRSIAKNVKHTYWSTSLFQTIGNKKCITQKLIYPNFTRFAFKHIIINVISYMVTPEAVRML